MPRQSPDAPTYLATRKHPELGLLLKIGSSDNPPNRCSSLGARLCGPLLPHDAESDLKRILYQWRVWDRARGDWPTWIEPVFSAWSEWFYATPEVGQRLRSYIREKR